MARNQIECRRISSDFLVPREIDGYLDWGLTSLLSKLAWGSPLILKGPKGSGKTLALEQWAAKEGVAIVRHDCTEDTSTRDLIGTFAVEGNDVYFALGALTTAIEVANEDGGCLLVLEEINALPPGSQKILNPIADYRQEINVQKIGKSFRVTPSAKVWMVGTMNPNYGGTYGLNEDFRSRFGFVEVGYMPEEQETELLRNSFETPPSAKERRIIQLLINIAKETRSGELEYALSTRDLVHFVRHYDRLGLEKALKMLEGKYEMDFVDKFRARIMTAFKVNLQEIALF